MNSNDDGPSMRELEVFAAVAEAGGFTAAARRLGTSKAMVSTAIARLEARLGVRLLQRSTRTTALTEAGAAALPHAQRAVASARDAEEAARTGLAAPRGVLRLNAPMSFGLLHVVPAVAVFAEQYPDVRVDLVLDDRVLDLVEGGFDLALRIGTLPDSALIAHRLAPSRNVVVAQPAYLDRVGRPDVPADLERHDALVYSLSSAPARWTFTRGGRAEEVQVTARLRATSSLALRHAALQGLGLTRIPTFVVGDDLATGRLEAVLPDWSLPEQALSALTTTRDHLPRKTVVFLDFLRARLGAPPYWDRPRTEPAGARTNG